MIDTPDSDNNNRKPNDDLGEIRPVAPEPADPTKADNEEKNPKQPHNYAQHVMRPIKAIGRGIAGVINWLDAKDGVVTAVATVVIAILTGYYVHYAKEQWRIMSGQLVEMQNS